MEHIPMCLADRVRISRNRISAVFSQQQISQLESEKKTAYEFLASQQ